MTTCKFLSNKARWTNFCYQGGSMKKIILIIILLLYGGVLLFCLEYAPHEIYYSSHFSVEEIIINNAADLFDYPGTHDPEKYTKSLTLELEASFPTNLYPEIKINDFPYNYPETHIKYNSDNETMDIYPYRFYIDAMSHLDGYFSRIINIKDLNGQIKATGYIFQSEKDSVSSADPWDNLVVMADGHDPDNNRKIYKAILNDNYENLFQPAAIFKDGASHQTLLSADYDICFVDFAVGDANICNNAKYYLKLLEFLSTKTSEKIIAGGLSMGGLVSRLSLLYAENQYLACMYKISKYLSIDTPHNGANIPIDMQDLVKFKQSDLKKKWEQLNADAAVQMLYNHIEYGNSEYKKFYDFLKSMGSYASSIPKYAIAGSHWNPPYPDLSSTLAVIAAFNDTNNPYNIYVKGWDLVPGSYMDWFKTYTDVRTTFLSFFAGLPLELKEPKNIYDHGYGDDRFKPTFIPVDSAFDIAPNTPADLKNKDGLDRLVSSGYTPFNKLYLHSKRNPHILFDLEMLDMIMDALNDKSLISNKIMPVIMNLLLDV